MSDLLRRNLEDILTLREQRARGSTILFGGDLLVPAEHAQKILSARLAPHGYTTFLRHDGGLTWVQILPATTPATPRSRPMLNVVLFGLTLLSTLAAGSVIVGSLPWVTFDPWVTPGHLLDGFPFAGTLLAILVTHEFGHYFTARANGVAVSLPYFIPAPPPFFFGTFGAVILMRAPARDRNALFDIAAAGPLAGLVIAVPALWIGLGWSHVATVPAGQNLIFGDSLLMRAMTYAKFGAIPPGMDVFVHPVALAGWFGLFVTALNLFPVGQLDGGRIAYALFGRHHRLVSRGAFIGLLLLAAVTQSLNWVVWAALLFFMVGFHHQAPVDDVTPLSRGRYALGAVCLALLVLLIPPVPIQVT
ncbi:MAG TPA: site-2 protease family protein [Candidatus Binatia bacterium]|nr:site-2 protease family protein [Candidatus Binatia bacterium]